MLCNINILSDVNQIRAFTNSVLYYVSAGVSLSNITLAWYQSQSHAMKNHALKQATDYQLEAL